MQPKFASYGVEGIDGKRLSPSSSISLDELEVWSSDRDSVHDGRGRQRKFVESAQQRQERHEFARRTRRLERNHIRSIPPQLSSTPTHDKERELLMIENEIAEAVISTDASKQLTTLLQKVKTLQTDEPRVMGTCLRLTKLINQLFLSLTHAERNGPYVWIEVVMKKQRMAAIEKIKSALVARAALDEVAHITQSIIISENEGVSGGLPLPSVQALLVRIEGILGDASLTQYLRLHINARITRKHLTTALSNASTAFACNEFRYNFVQFISASKPETKPTSFAFRPGPAPSPAVKPPSVLVATRMTLPFESALKEEIAKKPSFSSPSNSFQIKWVNIVKPLEDSDSDDFGDIPRDSGSNSGSDSTAFGSFSSFGSSGYSSLSSSPRTPLEAAFSPQYSRSNSICLSRYDSMAIHMPQRFESTPQFKSSVSIPSHLPIIESDEEDDYEDDIEADKARTAAREEALRKLCQASEWVQSIRDAKPVVLTKRKKRISVIPKLLTVGEEHEEE